MRIVQITTDSREHFKDYNRPAPYFGAAPEALLEGFKSIPGAEIHVVSCLREPVNSPSLLAPNIHYHPLIVPKLGWMTTGYQGCIRAVRECLRQISPDIVHGQGTEKDCAMSAIHSGFTNVLTIHGNMAEIQRMGLHGHPWYGKAATILETHSLKRTTGVFCNSRYTVELVAPRAKKTWLVPNAIRSAFFKPRPFPKVANDVPVLLNVGVVNPRKQQLEILRTARALFEQGYRFKLSFVGQHSPASEYGSQFEAELKEAVTAGYAEYLGFLDINQLIDLMDRSDGFVHFPLEESFGLVVAEAMARGLKFFGADLGGIRDIADGIPSADLHKSFDGLRAGIATWLSAGAPENSDAALEIFRRYSPAAVAARHMDVYREILNHH